jgi:prophage regulatory protein
MKTSCNRPETSTSDAKQLTEVRAISSAQIWRLPEVMATVGLTKSGVYQAISAKGFPVPVQLGSRAVGWKATEILQWLNARPRSSLSGFGHLRPKKEKANA